jgi:hypothetical protein
MSFVSTQLNPKKRKLEFEEESPKKARMQKKEQKPKKKLTISEFKVKPKIPDSFEENSWSKLQESIIAIFKKELVSFSQEELYKVLKYFF